MENINELRYAENKLKLWYNREMGKILNVLSVPYNSSIVFGKLISELLQSNKKVVYVTNDYEENKELIKYIKGYQRNIKYSYLKNYNTTLEPGVLYFINSAKLSVLKDDVELIIYDDITSFSNYSKLQIKEKVDNLYKFAHKIIVYSIEDIYRNMESMEISSINKLGPIIEPRAITTRINLEEDMPYILYEYLKWFKESKRKIVLHVPTEECGDKLYDLYTKKIKVLSDVKIIRFKERDEIKKIEKMLSMKNQPIMIITEYMGENLNNINDIDIIVINAENSRFDYKKIVYLCGKVGAREKYLGEVILISREVSDDMEKAKDITRYFNKLVWERGLLKV